MNVYVLRNTLHDSLKRISILAALVATSAFSAQAQVVFSPAVNVSQSAGSAPQVAVDKNGNIDVVWLGAASGPNTADLFFSRSTDGGTTFSTPLDVSPGVPATIREWPEIAVDGSGNISVVWLNEFQAQQGGPLTVDVYYTRSSDSGATFSAPMNVSHDGSGEAAVRAPMAVDSNGRIAVTWADSSTGAGQIFFAHSADGGSFFAPQDISNAPTGSNGSGGVYSPFVAIDGGNINILWSNGTVTPPYPSFASVFFSRSVDGGLTFSTPVNVSNSTSPNSGYAAQVATDGHGNIDAIWIDGNGNILIAQSSDGGTTFSAPHTVPGANFGGLAADSSGNINVFTYQKTIYSGNPFNGTAVYQYTGFFTRSTDGGATFSTPLQIATSYTGFSAQMITDAFGSIDIATGVGSNPVSRNSDLYLLRSTDGGTTFSSTNVSNDGGYTNSGYPPTIALDSMGNISVAWDDATAGSGNNIVYSRGTVASPSSLSAFGLSATDVTGGSSSTGTVTMNRAAPTGGAAVSLSSSDPSVSVPATVMIPEGMTNTTFSVATSPVAAKTTAVITVGFGGVTQTATIGVEPPVLASVTLNPSSTRAGSSSTGTVTLSGPAPSGGAIVALSSSNTSVATVTSSVTVPAGFSNATFTVNTSMSLCSNSTTITGSSSGVRQTANLAVMPPLANVPSQACTVRRGPRKFRPMQ